MQLLPDIAVIERPEDPRLKELIHTLEKDPRAPVAIDTETTGLDIAADSVIIWSLYSAEAGYRWVLGRDSLPAFDHLFADPGRSWYLTNAKFDMHMLANSGSPELAGTIYDTMVLDWLFDENKTGLRDLDTCSYRHLGMHKTKFKARFKTNRGEGVVESFLRYLRTEPENVYDYASMDAWLSYKLAETLLLKLGQDDPRLLDIYEKLYDPMIHTLWAMEHRGIVVNTDYLNKLGAYMDQEIDRLLSRMTAITGKVINFNSPDQLAKYFIDELDMPIDNRLRTDKGKPSMGKAQMEKWARAGNTMAGMILEYRGYKKLKSTYIQGLNSKARQAPDGARRVHTRFNLHITATGRLSSTDPNLQNIPARSELGHKIRRAFVTRPGYKIVVADYSQLEMRVLAHFSRDPNMIDIIKSGKDIHAGTASLMFGVPYEEIVEAKKADEPTDRQKELVRFRTMAKSIGFGLMYGMGPHHLAADLHISVDDAKSLMAQFFAPFKNINGFIHYVNDYAMEYQRVYTITGRPRRLPAAISPDPRSHAQAMRQAVNSVIQGSAADITASAMIKIHRNPELRRLGLQMLLQVHDEIVSEVPEEHAQQASKIKQSLMENPLDDVTLRVPLKAEPEIADSWGEAK